MSENVRNTASRFSLLARFTADFSSACPDVRPPTLRLAAVGNSSAAAAAAQHCLGSVQPGDRRLCPPGSSHAVLLMRLASTSHMRRRMPSKVTHQANQPVAPSRGVDSPPRVLRNRAGCDTSFVVRQSRRGCWSAFERNGMTNSLLFIVCECVLFFFLLFLF